MANKYITPEGKTKLLKLGFLNNDDVGNFNYLALGGENSTSASTENSQNFQEIDGNSYQRQKLVLQEEGDQSIIISATFDENIANPSEGVEIREIGIVDHEYYDPNEKFFAYAEVPPISKTNNISLKYTIIISIE
jgi:hypothetical protein